jgi:hypothetical protein
LTWTSWWCGAYLVAGTGAGAAGDQSECRGCGPRRRLRMPAESSSGTWRGTWRVSCGTV